MIKRRTLTAVPVALVAMLALAGCGEAAEPEPDAPAAEAPADTEITAEVPEGAEIVEDTEFSFVDGVLTTDRFTIEITGSEIVAVGAEGNEYGEKPLIAVSYDITNLGTSDREVSTMDYAWHFSAYQDNNPDRENSLDIGILWGADDDAGLDAIKPGGTVSSVSAYELDDLTTPVELVASDALGDEIGRMVINLD